MIERRKETDDPGTDREHLMHQPPAQVRPSDPDEAPEITEPSTEREPGEEPEAPGGPDEAEPSHRAQGIGVEPHAEG